MTVEEIITKREELDTQLKMALSSMALSNDVKYVRAQIKELQSQCSHLTSDYSKNKKCPFCGKILNED